MVWQILNGVDIPEDDSEVPELVLRSPSLHFSIWLQDEPIDENDPEMEFARQLRWKNQKKISDFTLFKNKKETFS